MVKMFKNIFEFFLNSPVKKIHAFQNRKSNNVNSCIFIFQSYTIIIFSSQYDKGFIILSARPDFDIIKLQNWLNKISTDRSG